MSWIHFKFNKYFKQKTKNNSLTVQLFFNLQNNPNFSLRGKLVYLERGREWLLIYLYYEFMYDSYVVK